MDDEKLKRDGYRRPRIEWPMSASKILRDPAIMDYIEEPYVVVMAEMGFWGPHNNDVISVMNLLHQQGWDTINIAYLGPRMSALLLNPRANPKYQTRQG